MSSINPMAQEISHFRSPCIQHLLQTQAERNPAATAIAAPGRSPLSYRRLLHHVGEVVTKLNSMGIGRNDRVAIVLPNGPEMAAAFLAVASGATAAPLNPAYRAKEFDFYFSDLKAKALIVQSGTDSPAIGAARERGIPVIELSPALHGEAGIFTLTGGKRPRPFLSGFARPDDVALALHTSGTTSRPKLVPLTQANICTSARNIGDTLQLSKTDRCLNVMPLFHIHGLIGALLSSLAAGASVICTAGLSCPNFFEWMSEFSPTWYSASPTIHEATLAAAAANREIVARNPLRFIRSSSSPLPAKTMAALEDAFNAPVIESYGMTEASHQIASNPLPPQSRKAGSVGLAAGSEIAVMDEGGNLLPKGKRGEIVLRGANVTQGYEHDQETNKQTFTHGWFRTGDEGFLDDQGYLFITGRFKEMINRGGEKISPREIDEVLMGHPAVAQAATFAIPHKTLGEDIAAAIVLQANASATAGEICEFAARRLANFKVPRHVVIVDEIPKGPTGKLQRNSLAEKLRLAPTHQSVPQAKASFTAPRSVLEKELANIWAETLGLERVSIRDNFFDLGGHSLLAAQLFVEIKRKFNKDLPPTILFQAPTVERLATMVRQEAPLSPCSTLVAIQPDGSNPPFFCVHPCGGSIFWYYNLARHLDLNQPVYGIQALGMDGKEPLDIRVEDMAARYIKAISAFQPSGPYFLGGFHFGGLVAFEMARQLQSQSQEVGLIALFDSNAPGYAKSLRSDRANRTTNGGKVPWFMQRADYHLKNLISLQPKQMAYYVLERFAKIEEAAQLGIKRHIKEMTYKFYRTIERSMPPSLEDLEDLHGHVGKDYKVQFYPGEVTLFRTTERPARTDSNPALGWDGVAGGLEIHEVPGKHGNILREPCVQSLAAQFSVCLSAAQQKYNRRPDLVVPTTYGAEMVQEGRSIRRSGATAE